MTDAASADAVEAVVRTRILQGRRVAVGRPHPTSLSMQFEVGEYSFSELVQLRDSLGDHFRSMEGATSLDLDERGNRVVLGVLDQAAMSRARSLVDQLGLDASLIQIRTREPVHPSAAASSPSGLCYDRELNPEGTICEYGEPVRGGTITRFDVSPSGTGRCTHSFPAEHDNETFMIGASHSSALTYEWDGADQQTVYESFDTTNAVGIEKYDDPGFFQGGERARYSDANLESINMATLSGEIARTKVRKTNGVIAEEGFEFDPANPTFAVSQLRQEALQGEVVDHMGVKSGWQYGTVDETCADVKGTDGFWRLCSQGVQDKISLGGDSGAPVFIYDGSHSVVPLGVNWGHESTEKSWYSPISGMETDYDGPFTFLGPS